MICFLPALFVVLVLSFLPTDETTMRTSARPTTPSCSPRATRSSQSWMRHYRLRPFIFLVPAVCLSAYAFLITITFSPNKESRRQSQASSIDCSKTNPRGWLELPRHNNVKEPADFEIEDPFSQSILRESICDERSRFLLDDNSLSDQKVWAARLLYMTVYEHQYGAARQEIMQQRHCSASDSIVQASNYECPEAKFLVLSLQNNGIGANFRLGAVPALMAALATDRILVLVNNAASGERFLREPWALASCPRHDAQCVFRPLSPCALLQDEIASAHILNRSSTRQLFRWGRIAPDHENDRVLVLHINFRPQRQPEKLSLVLHEKAKALILQYAPSKYYDTFRRASELILIQPGNFTGFSYYGEGSVIFHSLLLFLLRPREMVSARLDTILKEMFPVDHIPESSIGLPIRASDKCDAESECLSFPQHVQAAKEAWDESSHASSFVVTTESQEMLRQQNDWAKHSPAHFILNKNDVMQNTGYISDMRSDGNVTADDAMISALSSFKAQLRTGFTLGNCCSNFHLMLKDMLSIGCGSSKTNAFQCLQEHKNDAFQICCSWDKSERCMGRRAEAAAKKVPRSVTMTIEGT